MRVGVVSETRPGEARVALTPGVGKLLKKAGLEAVIETGAGRAAGFPDEAYAADGYGVTGRSEVLARADVICALNAPVEPGEGAARDALRAGQILVAQADALSAGAGISALAARGVTCFALDLMPRITRAQSMDVLSSQATIAGYKAVLLAAGALHKMFPMMITAAGTIAAARVLVIGAGVAGLQAIATAKRLGAVVTGSDVRPAAKEQILSLGAKFLDLPSAQSTEDKGGYARAMDEDFYQRQREITAEAVASSDAVITTAAVPGRRAPMLVTAAMVGRMPPGSIVVDLAASRGGNCELTRPDEPVVTPTATILGPTNLPASVPYHASQMFARNVAAFLSHAAKEGVIDPTRDDEILRGTLLTHGGEVVHSRAKEALAGRLS